MVFLQTSGLRSGIFGTIPENWRGYGGCRAFGPLTAGEFVAFKLRLHNGTNCEGRGARIGRARVASAAEGIAKKV